MVSNLLLPKLNPIKKTIIKSPRKPKPLSLIYIIIPNVRTKARLANVIFPNLLFIGLSS